MRTAAKGAAALLAALVGGAYLARRTTDSDNRTDVLMPVPRGVVDRLDNGTTGWLPPRSASKYLTACRRAARENGLPLDTITRMAQQESNFAPEVVSGKRRGGVGEVGILQIRPEMHAVNAFDPGESIDYCGRWVGRMTRKYNSLALGIASWNGGEGAARAGWARMHPGARRYAREILEDIAPREIPA